MTDSMRTDLPELPKRFSKLPLDPRGFPVPAFVGRDENDAFDFRMIKPGFRTLCYHKSLCWLCGEPLGVHRWFVIGPMCVVNCTTAEPPSHYDCAKFAATACPFLSNPLAKRNTRNLHPDRIEPPGKHIDRNPGCVALVKTRTYKPFNAGGGQLLRLISIQECEWYACGRKATRAEVDASIGSGLPLLQAEAAKDGPSGLAALERVVSDAEKWLPVSE